MDSSQGLRLFLLPEIIFSSHLSVLSLDKQKRICNYLSIIRFHFIKTKAYENEWYKDRIPLIRGLMIFVS